MPTRPFNRIALSLSGGGYRAAAFHLGALSLLHKIHFNYPDEPASSLLERVTALSTISGGSITGIRWAQDNAMGRPFEATFAKMYQILKEDQLLKNALEKINGLQPWQFAYKSKNLINAFAEVYDRDFFEGGTFGDLLNSRKGTIQEFIFNATEFNNGLAFRFQNNGRFGNGELFLPQSATSGLRLSDMAAASSCFPGGFEPLMFPVDFAAVDTPIAQLWSEKYGNPVALMDGGIIDNQGIDAIEIANDRLVSKGGGIGTFIVSDVEGKSITPYLPPGLGPQKRWSSWTLRGISNRAKWVFRGSLLFLLLCMILAYFKPGWWSWFLLPLLFVSGMISGAWLFVYKRIQNWFNQTVVKIVQDHQSDIVGNLEVLERTPVNVLINLAGIRATSLMTIANDVFMKRIRRIQYESLYTNKAWKDRVVGNFLYSLKDIKDSSLPDQWKNILETANRMPTTLWFSPEHKSEKMLDQLIMAGQLTLCHLLIDHVEEWQAKNNIPASTKKGLDQLYLVLVEQYEALKRDPGIILKNLI